jgi:hypothetical protein
MNAVAPDPRAFGTDVAARRGVENRSVLALLAARYSRDLGNREQLREEALPNRNARRLHRRRPKRHRRFRYKATKAAQVQAASRGARKDRDRGDDGRKKIPSIFRFRSNSDRHEVVRVTESGKSYGGM